MGRRAFHRSLHHAVDNRDMPAADRERLHQLLRRRWRWTTPSSQWRDIDVEIGRLWQQHFGENITRYVTGEPDQKRYYPK